MSLWPLSGFRSPGNSIGTGRIICISRGAPPHWVIPAFAVTETVAKILRLVLLLHFSRLDGAFGDRKKKIIKDHLVLKDDGLHT